MLNPDISQADIEKANYERFHHPAPIVQKRMHVIFLKAHRLPHQTIALMAGVHPNSVTNTLRTYQHDGFNGLKTLGYTTQQSQLCKHQTTLEAEFKQKPPLTVAEAGARIKAITGIARSPTQVRRFITGLGMRYRKMGQIPAKADPAAQAAFLEEELEPRIEQAQSGQCHLFFVDAAHFVMGPFLCALWCFCRPLIRASSGRKRYNVLGALHATSRALEVVTNTGYVNAETVGLLLRLLAEKYADLPIYLVMDNARYQRCRYVQALAESLGIGLLFLTPYSPNLNLIERLWRFVKKQALYGKYYESFDEFKAGIDRCIAGINEGAVYQEELKTLLSLKFQTFPFSQNQAA